MTGSTAGSAAGSAAGGGAARQPARPPSRQPSRQRNAVLALLDDLDEFRSAQDLHAMLRGRGEGVGLATVYRALQAMVDDGELDTLRTSEGESVYRRCSTGHHHHLVCRVCGRTVEVADPPVERWASRIAAEHGFVDVDHTVEVTGTCAACATGGPAGA